MRTMKRKSYRLDTKQKGEMPIGQMLLLGLITIPLITLLIVFKDEVTQYVLSESETMFDTPVWVMDKDE